MGVIAQYQVSNAFPSVLTNVAASGSFTYFASNPPQSLWNSGQPGVNTPQMSARLGNTPTASNALGQLEIYTQSGTPAGVNFVIGAAGEGKLLGNRFRVYATGNASIAAGANGTFTPIIQVNKGTVASPSYVTLGGNVASGAFATTPTNLGWSIAADVELDPVSATIYGFMKYSFAFASGGGTSSAVPEAAITVIQGLTMANAQGAPGFGLVVGALSTNQAFSASLYEFKVVQD